MPLAAAALADGSVRRRGQGQGSIYRSADGTWHASLRLGRDDAGRPIRRHVQAATRRQAVSKLELLRISCGPVLTVGDWTATGVDGPGGAHPEVLDGQVLPDTGRLSAATGRSGVERADGGAHRVGLHGVGGPGSLGRDHQLVHRTVRSCFGEAVKRGLIARNPVLVARPHRTTKAGKIHSRCRWRRSCRVGGSGRPS